MRMTRSWQDTYQGDRSSQPLLSVGKFCGSDEHSCKKEGMILAGSNYNDDDNLACSSEVASEASSIRSPRKTIAEGVKIANTHLTNHQLHEVLSGCHGRLYHLKR